MRYEDVPNELRALAFDFFYWLSRFEFALKEGGYLKDKTPGAKAEPDWQCLVRKWKDGYIPSQAARALMAANPKRQVVGRTGLEFRDVGFDDRPSELGKVVRLTQTVRNNLFHGGKHGDDSWDDPNRMRELLGLVISVLGELAKRAGIEGDYSRHY